MKLYSRQTRRMRSARKGGSREKYTEKKVTTIIRCGTRREPKQEANIYDSRGGGHAEKYYTGRTVRCKIEGHRGKGSARRAAAQRPTLFIGNVAWWTASNPAPWGGWFH